MSKGVWVIAEQRDGHLQKVSLELLGKAREIADKLNDEVTAILLGYKVDNLTQILISHGADNVIVVESVADLAIVGDLYKVVPEMISELKAYRESCEVK